MGIIRASKEIINVFYALLYSFASFNNGFRQHYIPAEAVSPVFPMHSRAVRYVCDAWCVRIPGESCFAGNAWSSCH
eukprot:scaffold182574_cov19-Tisochrysis_lutea.AAC.1